MQNRRISASRSPPRHPQAAQEKYVQLISTRSSGEALADSEQQPSGRYETTSNPQERVNGPEPSRENINDIRGGTTLTPPMPAIPPPKRDRPAPGTGVARTLRLTASRRDAGHGENVEPMRERNSKQLTISRNMG